MASKANAKTETGPITSYKGFNHDFTCRGHQFEVGNTYTVTGKVEACSNGFHACENPFDVWSYYPVVDDKGRLSRYAVVLQAGDIDRHDEDSKIASGEITVKVELSLPDFIRRAVDAVVKLTKGKGDNPSGHSAQIGSSGHYARIGSSGDSAQIVSEGKDAVIASAGRNTHASGIDGTWISLAEFGDNGKCVGFATGCIGQNGLKANTVYVARGGKLVEAA